MRHLYRRTQIKHMDVVAFVLSVTLVFAGAVHAQVENLDEMFARKARRGTATWDASHVENPSTFLRQAETFTYRDVTTGREVWKLSDTPGLANIYHNDIGVSPWSADGKRMAFANRRPTQAFSNPNNWSIWIVLRTDGSKSRAIVEGGSRYYTSYNAYFHWSPQVPDLYYEVGQGDGHSARNLYETVVTDSAVSSRIIGNYPESIKLDKMISGDGRKLLVSSYGEAMVYPTTVRPTFAIDDPNGYSIDRDMAAYGTTPTSYSTAHDRYYSGDGSFYFVMPIGGSHRAWWRLKTLGSGPDGGALCDNSDFPVSDPNYNFGECWPENADGGTNQDPFGSDYWSHFVPDMWGRYALHSSVDRSYSDPLGPGPGVWDIQNHTYVVVTFGGGSTHHDWHGFTDWAVSSGSSLGLVAQKFDDKNSQIDINSTYTAYNGGTAYNRLTRPGQSPDGTKVAWHSEFLNRGANATDIFWSVVYYPYPPTDLGASYAAGVRLNWLPPKYTERRWINAATGQIDEVNGEVLYAREISRYHLWRAASASGPWQEIGNGLDVEYGNDPVTNTLKPRTNGAWVNPANKPSVTDNPGDGTWYYALTSEEHSGLESDQLSEILCVVVSGTSVTTQVVQPKGQKDFWRAIPQQPESFSVAQQPTAGHYRLSWNEPIDSKIRYYNIYYSTTANPERTQAFRIASLPAGTSTYLDWLAASGTPANYGITSVDRHGNESTIVFAGGGDNTPPAAPGNLRLGSP